MKRRTVLAGAAATLAGTAGCLASTAEYERCSESVLVYDRLPEPVRAEVDAALEEGAYESRTLLVDRELKYEQVAGRSVDVLRKDGAYYEPRVESAAALLGFGRKRILSLEPVTLASDSPHELLVRNVTDERWTGVVTVDDRSGERLLEERLAIESSPREETPARRADADEDRIVRLPVTDEYGRYDATFDPDDGDPEGVELRFTRGYPPRRNRYAITDDGLEHSETLYGAVERPGHPPKPCSWDDEGELV